MEYSWRTKYGLVATVFFHGLLLLAFIFWGFSAPDPPPAEEGILINFGNSETGLGDIEPVGNENPQTQSNASASENEILAQNFEESVYLKDPKKNKKENVQTPDPKTDEKEEKKEQQVNQNALFPGNQNNSSGQGNTQGNGNQGSPDGSPNSNNYTGSGQGNNGSSWSLSGRNNKALPKPKYTGNEQGKVVVEIFVDQNGKVVKANTGYKGTTTSNQALRQAAYDAAMNAKFDTKNDAPEVQRGTITYIFELQ